MTTRQTILQQPVTLSHGAGGRASMNLIRDIFAHHLHNPYLGQGDDGARLPAVEGQLVLATDAHVVSPRFFPGGDIGALAVHGTINDVAMMGARPLWLTASFILEEGLPIAELDRLAESMGRAAQAAGVPVVAGDTKVVERGKGDGVFISTSGLGVVPVGRAAVSGQNAQAGDDILITGTLGDHGMAILLAREPLGFSVPMVSDSAALNGLIENLYTALAGQSAALHCLRDPTRGGVGNTLNEIASQSGVSMLLEEAALPVRADVAAACEFLGLDPLYIANEGKALVVCSPSVTPLLLQTLRQHPLGKNAARIGQVVDRPVSSPSPRVEMRTVLGGTRFVDWLTGDQLPRIC